MDPHLESFGHITRRHFLGRCNAAVGAAALAGLTGNADGVTAQGTPGPHFAPNAKRVIYLHMAGSPPQQDLFDYKPKLKELDGQLCPESLIEGERFAFIKGHPKILASPYEFERCGESGIEISELMPGLRTVADDLTVVRSMYTEQFNHAPAQLLLYTGSPRIGRPSMGSWLTYGLGTDNENLPSYVVLVSGNKKPSAGTSVWGSGFLPTVHQGIQCRSGGDPVLYLSDPDGMDRAVRRRSLDALNDLNEMQYERDADPETRTRIAQYELAFRMQMSVPEAMDIEKEPETVREAYGVEPGEASFANNCLLARRLVERGVRFVQLFDWGWDVHGSNKDEDIISHLPKKCAATDRPITALLKDLKQRGLLDETLVIWSGEFGRTAMNEERDGSKYLGRDHHPHCFSIWMAGGGVNAGTTVGTTDELGHTITEQPVHIHDLQATILHLMGFDHERLTYRFEGRDFRLTDVAGKVVPDIIG